MLDIKISFYHRVNSFKKNCKRNDRFTKIILKSFRNLFREILNNNNLRLLYRFWKKSRIIIIGKRNFSASRRILGRNGATVFRMMDAK